MPTIPITRELGVLITKLKHGHAITINRGWSQLLLPQQYDHESVDHRLVKLLKKRGFIELLPYDRSIAYNDLHWWQRWHGGRVYVLSDAGKSFPLPPENMWLEEE